MEKESKIVGKIKRQITLFSAKLTVGLNKPKRRFVHQMIYGIQASKDIKLSNISRALGENISLIKTENRLSRQINKEDLTSIIGNRLTEEGKALIEEDTVLALDLSDISKEHSKKQEYLALVRNGSSKKGEIKKGYWLIGVIGAEVRGEKVIPLYGELYSQLAKEFRSENLMILGAIDRVRKKVGNKGIYAVDRGGDRQRLFRGFLKREIRFVVRLTGARDLIVRNGKGNSGAISRACRCGYKAKVRVRKEGAALEEKILYIGWKKVRFTFSKVPLTMVVVKGFGEAPLMLLTNLKVDNEEEALKILEIYLTRWKCEESWRFIKQGYKVEDVRLLKYRGLRNIIPLVMAVFFFVSVVLGMGMKLRILLKKIYEKAKRFFEIPPFKQYAICDGIHNLLWGRKFCNTETREQTPDPQLILPLEVFTS